MELIKKKKKPIKTLNSTTKEAIKRFESNNKEIKNCLDELTYEKMELIEKAYWNFEFKN